MLSPRLPLDANKIAATIEGIGSVTPITEGFDECVEIWKKGVMLEKGFWFRYPNVSRHCGIYINSKY